MKTSKKQGYLEGTPSEKLTKEILITSPVVLFKNVYLENFFFFLVDFDLNTLWTQSISKKKAEDII